jgi:hypothetical protein
MYWKDGGCAGFIIPADIWRPYNKFQSPASQIGMKRPAPSGAGRFFYALPQPNSFPIAPSFDPDILMRRALG